MKKIFSKSVLILALITLSLGVRFIKNDAVSYASTSSTNLEVEIVDDSSLYNETQFVNIVGVPTSIFTYENNGGGTIANAFDRNWNTDWVSEIDNNVNDFRNTVTVYFNSTVTIDSVLYASSNYKTGYGFATKFNIYSARQGEELSLVGYGEQTATSSKIRIIFPEAIQCDKLMFEYVDINRIHKYVASAKEFIFCQPAESLEAIYNLFTDYAQYQLDEQYNNLESITALRESVKDCVNYEESLKPILDRAESIIKNSLVFDVRREFSTSSDATNVLDRVGDIASYARGTLKMDFMGTNRLATGIAALAGEVINVYVEADEGDKLPKLVFAQVYGHWSSWRSGENQLARGLNTFVVPNFVNSSYTVDVLAGCAIYLCNPYTETQQSENVKVYIEGGELFPVFRLGDDVASYKLRLSEYANMVNEYPEKYINVTELVSNHTIMTVRATQANTVYLDANPQTNLEYWDELICGLLTFDGVQLNENGDYFDIRNLYLKVNIRVCQPLAGAAMYAHYEHIGIYAGASENVVINCSSNPGWGFVHEIGHMMDIRARRASECSNNMIANYNAVVNMNMVRNQDYFSSSLQSLTNERTLEKNLWSKNTYNYIIYWQIESLYLGYWGRQDNYYRYSSVTGLTNTETQIYYSSLATGIDLSYYFERWGYCLNGEDAFVYEKASDAFKTYIIEAIESGLIKQEVKKLWYLDDSQYLYMQNYGNLETGAGGCYNQSVSVNIANIYKTGSGYSIMMPTPTNTSAHLGYEILEGNDEAGYEVIGFTYTNNFMDTTTYPDGYIPTYKIIAYDRLLNCTSASEKASVSTQEEAVCKIGDTEYSSLSLALANASSDDTITIIANISDTGIVIDKNITITIDDSLGLDFTIFKIGAGNLFSVSSECTLTLVGGENHKLILDGNNLNQAGALISSSGTLYINSFVKLQNSINTGTGGAINALAGTVNLNGCEFYNNSAQYGGAIGCSEASVKMSLSNVSFSYNHASLNGGAIYSLCTISIENSTFHNNSSGQNGGAISNYSGGVIKITDCEFYENESVYGGALYLDGNTTLNSSSLHNNSASVQGGAIYSSGSNTRRYVTINLDSAIYENSALSGGAIYLNKGKLTILLASIYGNVAQTGSNLYQYAGDLIINGNSKMSGKLYYVSGSITIQTKIYSKADDYEIMTFNLNSYADDMLLLSTNFTLSEEDLDGIIVANASTYIGENNQSVYVSPIKFSITLNVDGKSEVVSAIQGSNYTLPDSAMEQKYVLVWVDENGNQYKVGDTIVVSKNTTFTAQTKEKYKIILNYLTSEQEVYIKPNEKFYFPQTSTDSTRIIICWEDEVNSYLPCSGIEITQSGLIFTAVYENLLKVTFNLNDNVYAEIYNEYFTYVNLVAPNEIPNNYRFSHFEIDGKNYEADSKVLVLQDTSINAVLVRVYNLTFVIGDEVITKEADEFSTFTIEEPQSTNGKTFAYYLVDGKKYYAGDTITITSDLTLTAVYKNPFTTEIIILITSAIVAIIAIIVIVKLKKKRKN